MTEQQRIEALAACDQILEANERARATLSEGLSGLIEAFDEMARLCRQPKESKS